MQGLYRLPGESGTASKPIPILCRDGHAYICKSRYTTGQYYTPANELTASLLAEWLNLPTTRFHVVAFKGENYFGSEQLKRFPFDPQTIPLPHSGMIADIYVFDVWICNPDRHRGNVIAVETFVGPDEPALTLKIIDHGLSLFGHAGEGEFSLLQQNDSREDIQELVKTADDFSRYITSLSDFDAMLHSIESLTSDELRDILCKNPWLAQEEKDFLFEILSRRQRRLKGLFAANRALFGIR